MPQGAFRWPRLIPSDALAVALIVLAVVLGVHMALPLGAFVVFTLLGVAFALLTFAKRS